MVRPRNAGTVELKTLKPEKIVVAMAPRPSTPMIEAPRPIRGRNPGRSTPGTFQTCAIACCPACVKPSDPQANPIRLIARPKPLAGSDLTFFAI